MPRPEALDRPATTGRARALASAGLSPADVARALSIASDTPAASDWQVGVLRVLLALGAGLGVAGVIFFFAYNWASLGHLSKMSLLAGGIAAASAVSLVRKEKDPVGAIALIVAMLLIGPLLAVFGQAYQTGADTYQLFLTWTALALPFALAARAPVPWLISVVLLDTTIFLAWDALVPDRVSTGWLALSLYLVNGTAYATSEVVVRRTGSRHRGLPRALLFAAMFPAVISAVDFIMSHDGKPPSAFMILVSLGSAGCLVPIFHRNVRDLFLPTIASGTAITVVTTLIAKLLMPSGSGPIELLFIALALVAEVALAAAWLRREARGLS